MTSLKKQTVSGIKWTFVASIAQRALSLVATVVLARILSPADFGLFALAFVMIDGFGIFKSLGFDSALVRRKDDIEKAANTAFFLIPAMGLILFVILLILAPIGAKFLNHPDVANIIRVLAVIFVISCFGKVPQTILYRDMKFKYKSIADMSATTIYVSTAIILALAGYGVWSLVIAYVLKNIVQISVEWYFSGWKPKFEFDKEIAWDMFHFGKYVLGSGIVWFLSTNLDNIVIGKYLGISMLGFYAIARNASNILNDYLLGKTAFIMYPAYSKIQENPEDVKRVMLKTLKYVSMVAIPFSFALSIFAPDILRIVFGAKWLPAAGVLRILAFAGMLGSLGSAIWPIFLARGKSKADLQVNLIQVAVFFVLVIPLSLKFQLIGAGIAVLLSNIFSFAVGLFRTKQILQIRFLEVFQAVRSSLLCSLSMALAAYFLKSFSFNSNIYINFVFAGSLSALVYIIMTYLMNRSILRDIKEVMV